MADRIVVMNHGVIEQVGTPLAIYREPASSFVADFVGKVNVLPGQIDAGVLRLGQLSLAQVGAAQGRSGAVKVYLRPEDILVRAAAAGGPQVDARIVKIEFLGAFCHVQVDAPQVSDKPLVVDLSLNFLSEQGLREGSDLVLTLMPERIKIY
jgi:iron(III) transport system ATP-binding protein